MGKFDSVKEKWQGFCRSAEKKLAVPLKILRGIGNGIKVVCSFFVRQQKILMAAPVVLAAGYLAQESYNRLPKLVGIGLQASGEFAQMVSRDTAVAAPLVVTAVCLLLMFCSRRTVYPWLISIFSLVLPILIWVTNVFPA